MKSFAWIFVVSCSFAAYSQTPPAKLEPTEHTFVIHNLHTESGVTLPEAKIVVLTVSDDDADLFAALRYGVDGYLLKTMNFNRLPDALNGVCSGEAAMQPALVARVLEQFRRREPRWRRPAGAGPAQRLTSREWEVLELLAQGRSTAKIAERLVLSPSAVRVHVASIVRKLGVPGRAAAVDLFRRHSDN